MKRIAIQGIKGSFHDIASQQYFAGEEIDLVCCNKFEEVFAELHKDPRTLALIAIENTIAGSLLHNYELLRNSHAKVIGEQRLHIEHSLMCLPNEDWEDLREVNSHPVALMQCRDFLNAHPQLKVVEVEDTAGAAAHINQQQLHHHAAICHKDAAKIYGMKVLQEGIETNKHNYTRFLVVAHPSQVEQLRKEQADSDSSPYQIDKASLVFSIPHTEGSLSAILIVLSSYQMNLTKIQSLPIIGEEWQYLFYVDVNFDDYARFQQAITAITPLTRDLDILGEYKEKKA